MIKKGLFILLAAVITACSSTTPTIVWVKSDNSQIQIKRGNNAEKGKWVSLQSNIEKFNYEKGFLYQLSVQKNASLKNQATYNYTLIKELKKIAMKKTSLENEWELRKIVDKNGNLQTVTDVKRTLPHLNFNVKEMKFNGMDGCNYINGTIEKTDNKTIIFGNVASTKVACIDMELPNRFVNALNAVQYYNIENNKLQLSDANKKVLLEFVKKPKDY